MDDPREPYGRLVHETRLAYEAERAPAEGRPLFRLGSWEERPGERQELDMRIGEAVAAAGREHLAACMDDLAANYPEDVFPSSSLTVDGISGTAMRLAYSYAARFIREGHDNA